MNTFSFTLHLNLARSEFYRNPVVIESGLSVSCLKCYIYFEADLDSVKRNEDKINANPIRVRHPSLFD